jgi:2-phospho-L-lactate guanylyltransferase
VPTIWAVLPVNHLNRAKSRLAPSLGQHRSDFAKCLMLHTLDALQGAGVFDGIVVVTPDERVAALATAKGAKVVADRGASLNEACSLGLDASRSLGADLTVFVHADLALLRAHDICLLLAAYRAACAKAAMPLLGLVRCKDGDGTNIVFCGRATPFVPHFGPRSFSRHAATSAFCELVNANAAFDIDTGTDLAHLLISLDRLDLDDPIAQMLGDEGLRQDIFQRQTSERGRHASLG